MAKARVLSPRKDGQPMVQLLLNHSCDFFKCRVYRDVNVIKSNNKIDVQILIVFILVTSSLGTGLKYQVLYCCYS